MEERRGRLNPTTGHIAESFAATVLADHGWHLVWQFTGPTSAGHGTDLIMASDDLDKVFAIEVKATLSARRWPRLAHGATAQMSAEWLDEVDNPGMDECGLAAADVYGLIVLIQFARRQWIATPPTSSPQNRSPMPAA
jgi:Holliday junction resolvase-like predicted endonuclease